MKKLLTSVIAIAFTVVGLSGVACLGPDTYANGVDSANDMIGGVNDGNDQDLMEVVKIIINVILGIVGLIAVVMIIVGGIQYTTSQGDAQKVKKAKDTILYGVVGLVVALLAFAIVNFVLTNVFNA